MAKDRKKSKRLLPKRIAGIKVPKAVRKGRFGELLASPRGQALIAQAVLGVGAVAGGLKAKDSSKVKSATQDVKAKLGGVSESVAETNGALAYALGEAARSFAEAYRRGGPEPRSLTGAGEALRPQERPLTTANGLESRAPNPGP